MSEDDAAKLRWQAALTKVAKHLTEQGLLIEAGWVTYRVACIPRDASTQQLDDQKMCFFAGAQHVWGSLFSILDPGKEATDGDLTRMEAINTELDRFAAQLEALLARTRH